MKRLVMLAVLVVGAAPAFAQDKPAADKAPAGKAAPPAAPQLPPEVKKTIDAFAGTWTFQGTVRGVPGTTGPIKAKETFTCKGVAGRYVACSGKGTIEGMGKYEDHALISWDAGAKNMRFVGFDSIGQLHDHTCTWKDDRTVTCQPLTITAADGQPGTVDFTMTWTDAKNVTFIETTTTKGGEKISFEGAGKRK
jgi:hypothetical protein